MSKFLGGLSKGWLGFMKSQKQYFLIEVRA